MTVYGVAGSSKGSKKAEIVVSQLFLEIEYLAELDIHKKSNGTWKSSYKTFQKQNGTWVNMTEDECKNYIKSNLIIDKCAYRGYQQITLSDIEMTCIDDGATGGIMCSYCHKTLKEHDIIPSDPNNHSYYVTGVCKHCSAVHPEQITFTITYGTDNGSSLSSNAIQGMTWEEWINGDKTLGYLVTNIWSTDGSKVLYTYRPILGTGGSYVLDNVTPTDIIIADATYSITPV